MTTRRSAGAAALLMATACTAEIGSPPDGVLGPGPGGSGGPGHGGGPGGNGSGGNGTGGNGSGGNGAVVPAPERTWPTPAFARLTHAQWENTVVDVFGLEASEARSLSATFRDDPAGSGYLFDNHTVALSVDEVLWTAYRRAAGDIGALLFEDDGRRAAFVGRYGGEDDAATFVAQLGAAVHRRPLDESQLAAYLDVYTAGRDLYPELGDDHAAGLRLVTEAFLQSPYFVYRVELGDDPNATTNPLDAFEIASRLSYFLWNTAPDAALRSAAASGELSTEAGLTAQVDRLLSDARAGEVVAEFHRQLLDVQRYDRIGPSPAFFPEVTDRLPELAREETDRFIAMVWSEEGGLTTLLTSRETYVNADLAGIYGLEGDFDDDAFTRVELDASTRKGWLTQVGFLASHATAVDPDPIHRGIFSSERLACNTIGVPPGDIPPLPAAEGRTNREVVESHTEQPGTDCVVCHASLINPFGFAFESYDAAGGFRTEDRGWPVDTTGAPEIAGETVPVSDALELIDVMAASEAVHACYAKHWMELAFGVRAERGRDGLVERVADASLNGASVREVLRAIATSETFRTRRGGGA
jgi:hypothetical protein